MTPPPVPWGPGGVLRGIGGGGCHKGEAASPCAHSAQGEQRSGRAGERTNGRRLRIREEVCSAPLALFPPLALSLSLSTEPVATPCLPLSFPREQPPPHHRNGAPSRTCDLPTPVGPLTRTLRCTDMRFFRKVLNTVVSTVGTRIAKYGSERLNLNLAILYVHGTKLSVF